MHKNGFTLIEVLVSLALFGIVLLVTTGLILPLNLTRASSAETSAIAVGQSYLELLKSKWSDDTNYTAMTLPTVCNAPATCDLKILTGWSLGVKSSIQSVWAATDLLRNIVIEVQTADGKKISFSTLVAKP